MSRVLFEQYLQLILERYREGKCTQEEIDAFARFFSEQYDPELTMDEAAKVAGVSKRNLSVHLSRKAMKHERPVQRKVIRFSVIKRLFGK